MANEPSPTSKTRMSNIIGRVLSNFEFKDAKSNPTKRAFGKAERLSAQMRHEILAGTVAVDNRYSTQRTSAASVMALVQSSLGKASAERAENRKILQLMPSVAKAARLMVASTFAPNDMSAQEIQFVFDAEDLTPTQQEDLATAASVFFQKKLRLMTSAPKWAYEWAYESGASIHAIIPIRSFKHIMDTSFVGAESYENVVLAGLESETLYGFGDGKRSDAQVANDFLGMESLVTNHVTHLAEEKDVTLKTGEAVKTATEALIKAVLGTESLSLTDNPDILQAARTRKEKVDEHTSQKLSDKYKGSLREDFLVSVSAAKNADGGEGGVGDPIFLHLPTESVTVIHTPGDPNDHQGYLVLLDAHGNPIDIVTSAENSPQRPGDYSNSQGNVFSQVYNAYGLTSNIRGGTHEEAMSQIYTEIISTHLKKRLGKAGFDGSTLGVSDSAMRCMFARFLQNKKTKVLFLPKELVSYMSYEKNQHGYGISRLDQIKFSLGLKMAVQISKVMASVKAAMDKRRIEMRFSDNLMESPEALIQSIMREFRNKNTMAWTTDPNDIQTQIIDKSIVMKLVDVPGMENFDITNEPDQRSSAVDFDPDLYNQLENDINNGMKTPAAAMNQLSESEYSRSVATTNLFFAMDIGLDQGMTIENLTDLVRKYARYSEAFQEEIFEIAPSLRKKTKSTASVSSTDDAKTEVDDAGTGDKAKQFGLPDHYTIDSLIDTMSVILPKPNIAPSKAQFEAFEAMVSSISGAVEALFPDDLVGADDTLAPIVRFMRARFKANNIKAYLETSGMSSIEVPDYDFASHFSDILKLSDSLENVKKMLEDQSKISQGGGTDTETTGDDPMSTGVPGY